MVAPRRKVFISYHHAGDASYYDAFVRVFGQGYELIRDHSVDREIDSLDADYVIRRIRERYLTGASATIVLCGRNTWGRRYVDWEILASLNQEMGLVGLNLPTNLPTLNGTYSVPGRLHDNVQTGYAVFLQWNSVISDPTKLAQGIESALAKPKRLIDNSRSKRLRSESLH